MKKVAGFLIAGLFSLVTLNAFAADESMSTCSIVDKHGKQWDFSAAKEDDAMSKAKKACEKHSADPANCSPICYAKSDQNFKCTIVVKKNKHHSFKASTEDAATQLAKNACEVAGIKDEDCKPDCTAPK